MSEPAPAPSRFRDGEPDGDGDAKSSWRSGWAGCGLWAAAFLVVTIGGCAIGLTLRSDPDSAQKPVTVEAGDGWTFQVYQDEVNDPCTQLIAEDASEAATGDENGVVAGQCAFGVVADPDDPDAAPQYRATSFTIRGRVVVFGPVPDEVATVRLNLVDGSQPTVRTSEHNGVHYFVRSVEAEDKGPTILLDSAGREVTPG